MTKRLFFGLELPDDWKSELRAIQQSLRMKSVNAAAWSNPSLIHITVVFLGMVPDESIPAVYEAGMEAAAEIKPIQLATGSYGAFSRNRIFWLGLHRGETDWDELVTLNRRVTEEVLQRIPIDLDDKHYRPHITLARKLDYRGDVTKWAKPDRLTTVIGNLCLFESVRVDGELTYPVRARFPFSSGKINHDDVFPQNT